MKSFFGFGTCLNLNTMHEKENKKMENVLVGCRNIMDGPSTLSILNSGWRRSQYSLWNIWTYISFQCYSTRFTRIPVIGNCKFCHNYKAYNCHIQNTVYSQCSIDLCQRYTFCWVKCTQRAHLRANLIILI